PRGYVPFLDAPTNDICLRRVAGAAFRHYLARSRYRSPDIAVALLRRADPPGGLDRRQPQRLCYRWIGWCAVVVGGFGPRKYLPEPDCSSVGNRHSICVFLSGRCGWHRPERKTSSFERAD